MGYLPGWINTRNKEHENLTYIILIIYLQLDTINTHIVFLFVPLDELLGPNNIKKKGRKLHLVLFATIFAT